MAEIKARRPPCCRRLQRWLIATATAVLLLTAAWTIIERFVIDIDRYRPRVEARLAAVTGFDAQLGPLNLNILPYLHVTARDIRLRHQAVMLDVGEVTIDPRLGPLIRGAVHIKTIRLENVNLVVPEDPEAIREAMVTLKTAIEQRPRTRRRVHADTLVIGDATLYWGHMEPVLKAKATVTDVTSPRAAFEADADVTAAGPGAVLRADGYILPQDDPLVTGRVQLTGLDLRRVYPRPDMPAALADAAATFQASDAQHVTASLSADIQSASPLAGTVAAEAQWLDDVLTLRDIVWLGNGMTVRAALVRQPDGRVDIEVAEAVSDTEGLRRLLPLVPSESLFARPHDSATAALNNVVLSVGGGQRPRFASGTGEIGAIDVVGKEETPIVSGVRTRFSVEDNRVILDTFAGDGFALTGRLEAAPTTAALRASLEGTVDLAATRLEALLPGKSITGLGGQATLDEFSATLSQGKVTELTLSGQVRSGRATVQTGPVSAEIRDISAQFSSVEGMIQSQASGQSTTLGPLGFEGRYEVPARRLTGKASAIPGKVLEALLTAQRAYRLSPLIDALGPASHDLTVVMPPGSDDVEVRVVRETAPDVTASVTLRQTRGTWQMVQADASGSISAQVLAALGGEHFEAEGRVPIVFERKPGEETFSLSADLTASDVRMGRPLRKEPGLPATTRVEGTTAPAWAFTHGRLDVAGERLDFQFAEDRVLMPVVDVSLQPLSPLLTGVALRGAISGSIGTNPLDVQVLLNGVGLAFASGAGVDTLDGDVRYRPEQMTIDGLRVRGANSAALLTARLADGQWTGHLTGEKLDVDAAWALYETLRELAGRPASEAPEAPPRESDTPPQGTLTVAFDEVLFRDKPFEDVTTQVVRDRSGIHLQNISFSSHPGRANGTIHLLTPPYGGSGTIETDFTLDDFDAAYLDRLLFAEPRGLEGRVNATLRATAPNIGGVEAVRRADGHLSLSARKGTLGRLGFATQILALLRNLEVFQLRLPTLRDEGLVFDDLVAELRMERGVITFEDCRLTSRVYAMAAAGTVDFPRDQTDVAIRVDLTEGVTRYIHAVPLLGQAVGTVTGMARLRLLATGSPFDVRVRPDPGSRVEGLADRIGGIFGGGRSSAVPLEEDVPVEDDEAPAVADPPDGAALDTLLGN